MKLVTDCTGNDLTYRIIGAAMSVHNQLGPGYKEEVYENALYHELLKRNIRVVKQVPVDVMYDDTQVAQFFLDLFVEEQVIVELKAFPHLLTNDELGQVVNYLKATQAPVALLINFGRRKLDFRRVFPGRVEEPKRAGRDNVRKSNLPEVD